MVELGDQGFIRHSDDELMHWAKGETVRGHKWIERKQGPKGWIYKYKDSKKQKIEKEEKNKDLAEDRNYELNNSAATAKYLRDRASVQYWNADQTKSRENVNTKRAMDRIKDSRAREEYNNRQKQKADSLRTAGKTLTKEAKKADMHSEDLKRQQSSARAAIQREESKKLKNRGKRFVQNLFGEKTIRTKDGIIFKRGLSQTKVTFGEVKVH